MMNRKAVFTLLAIATPIAAQWLNYPTAGVPRLANGQPNLAAPAPRTPDGKPDFSGLWEVPFEGGSIAPVAGAIPFGAEFQDIASRLRQPLPYRPWALALVNSRMADNGKDMPSGSCLPHSIVAIDTHPLPRRVVQAPGILVILHEQNTDFRQIFTDARPLPVDPNPSWFGYSSGKWDGDTLVVQTIGFRDGLWADQKGNPITDMAKVTERFRRPNFGILEIEITLDDPKAYTAPWTVTVRQRIKLDTELLEYICLENEKDLPHLVGK